MNNKDLHNRLLKGIDYFLNIKPSEWNYATTILLKREFLEKLLKPFLEELELEEVTKEASNIFGQPSQEELL